MKRTFKFVFWLGVASFVVGLGFQLFGRVTALEAQMELDRQLGGETVPAWVTQTYGEDMVFAGAISATAGAFGWLLVGRCRRRETDIEDFKGDVSPDFFDRLGEKTKAYFEDLRIPKFPH